MLQLLWFLPSYEPQSLEASTYLLWYALYAGLFALFYVFSSPFTGNRELRRSWSGYVYFSTILYIWLGMAVAFHLPILHYDIKVPVSLFSPLFLGSALTLFACEGVLKVLNRWYVFHVGFKQNSLEVLQNSFVVSLTCCLVYSQCGSVTNESLSRASFLGSTTKAIQPELDAGIDRMCIVLFSGHVDSKYAHLPMVLVLWCTAMSALVLNFFIERISGYRGMFSDLPTPSQMAAAEVHAHANAAGNLSEAEEEDVVASLSPRGANDRVAKQKEAQHRQISFGPAASAAPGAAGAAGAPLSIIPPATSASGSSVPLAGSYKSRLAKIRPLLFRDMLDPPMLEMVPWYALLTSITGVDMLIHLKLFVGRFDMRTLQAVTPNSFHYTQAIYTSSNPPQHALSGSASSVGLSTPGFTSSNSLSTMGGLGSASNSTPNSPTAAGRRVSGSGVEQIPPTLFNAQHVHPHHLDAPLVYDHCAEDDELWFDWMSDCGDGWNSSYQVCRVLAKPLLHVSVRQRGGQKPGALYLPRGKMLVIGGDLAYPSPNEANYEQRFFRPFQCALPPPLNYDPSALSMHKPPIPGGVAGLRTYAGPTCFAIPGNHDWFDGLQTYLRYVCSRDWLGGWLLPQERSFFALQLPKGWWLFGLDNALSDDIDALQFKYFASIIDRMGEDDRVILSSHEPDWIIDTHDQRTSGENTNYLIKILKGKVALRLAGDIHNYTRHMPSPLIPGISSQPSLQSTVRAAAQAFNASAASSLFRGMIDAVFSQRDDSDESEQNTVSGVVDATLRNAVETGARLQASEGDHGDGAASVPTAQRTTYKSMLYSRFTGWGGDGEGIFMEDIKDTLNPSMPLLRTQSMPAIPHGFDENSHTAGAAAAAAAPAPRPPLAPSTGGKLKKRGQRRSPLPAAAAAEAAAGTSSSFLPPAPPAVVHQARSASPATFLPSKANKKRQADVADADPLLAVLGPQLVPGPGATAAAPPTSWSNLDPPPDLEDDSASSSSSSHTMLTAQERRNKKKREAKARKQAQRAASAAAGGAEGLSVSNTANSSYANLPSGSSSHTSLDAASPPRSHPTQKDRASSSVRRIQSTPHHDAILSWSTDEVLEWLSSVGIEDGAIHAAFSSQDIDGRLLLELDHTDLAQELHIASQLKRKKILAEIRAMVAAARKKDAAAAESRPLSDEEEDSGRNSEDEQISENILSSRVNLSEMSGLSSRARKAPPALNATTSESPTVYLPPGSASSRAATGPELSLTVADVNESFQFGPRNVDVISLAPSQDLTIANAAASLDALGVGHRIPIPAPAPSPSPAPPTRPSPTPSPLLEGEEEDSVAAHLSPLSMSARKRAAKKARQQQQQAQAQASSSRSASPAVPTSYLSSSVSSASFLKPPRRREEESLFGSAATGTMANSPRRSETELKNSSSGGVSNNHGASSSSSSSHSRHSSRASSGGSSGRHAPLYNNASSAPIPTDVRETINISLPEGSDAPKELLSQLAGEEEDGDTVGSIGGTENVRPPPVLIVSGGGGAFMHPTHCFDESTRLLTSEGFLFGREISSRLADAARAPLLFACYDRSSSQLLYRPASNNRLMPDFHTPEGGSLVDFTSLAEQRRWAQGDGPYGDAAALMPSQSNGVSLRVTAGHTMFAQCGNLVDDQSAAGPPQIKVNGPHSDTTASGQRLRADSFLPSIAGELAGLRFMAAAAQGVQRTHDERAEFFRFLQSLGVQPCDLCLDGTAHPPPFSAPPIAPPSCAALAFLELYGFWLGAGSMHTDPNSCISAIAFALSDNKRKSTNDCGTDNEWLRLQLPACGLQASEWTQPGDQARATHITRASWREWFRMEYGAKYSDTPAAAKWLAPWALTLLDKEQLRWLIQGLWRADGEWSTQKRTIYTESPVFRDQLAIAMFHAGYAARVEIDLRDTDKEPVRSTAARVVLRGDAWAVHFDDVTVAGDNSTAAFPSLFSATDVREVDYAGQVWCVQVDHPDHLVVAQRAKRDDKGQVTCQSMPVIVGNCPDPEPILFRGNRYVRASSYPPVALSRAYALLNLFGFRKQNWRFDMFGGFLYFALAFSVLPICNLGAILHAHSWYDVIGQYLLAVWQAHAQVFLQGYVSLFAFILVWITLMSFGEVPWPWYKRFFIGTCHTLAHSFSAISALVLLESCIELGRERKIIGQGDFLWATFAKNFPEGLARIESADTQFLGGLLGALMRGLSNVFDVPDNIASLKLQMCESYSTVTRPTLILYYLNNGLYLWVLMTPLVSFMFGAYLYVASAFLNAHYTEAFSSLRIEGYKNIVRFHINRRGDLEVYTLGLDKVPTRWVKDPKWSGQTELGSNPSHAWDRPSVLKPEKGQPDRIKLIDYLIIPKNPRNKNAWSKKGGSETPVA